MPAEIDGSLRMTRKRSRDERHEALAGTGTHSVNLLTNDPV
jgi:hypothetical protein